MGAWAEAQVGGVIPVFFIVAGEIFFPPGKVGNFVVNITLGLEEFRRADKEFPLVLFPRQRKIPGLDLRGEGGIFFNGQLITGEVFWGICQRCRQRFQPGIDVLARDSINQIQPEVLETGSPGVLD